MSPAVLQESNMDQMIWPPTQSKPLRTLPNVSPLCRTTPGRKSQNWQLYDIIFRKIKEAQATTLGLIAFASPHLLFHEPPPPFLKVPCNVLLGLFLPPKIPFDPMDNPQINPFGRATAGNFSNLADALKVPVPINAHCVKTHMLEPPV